MAEQKPLGLILHEVDGVGIETATYTCSSRQKSIGAEPVNRVDVTLPADSTAEKDEKKRKTAPIYSLAGIRFRAVILFQSLLSVFLPSGFPYTVTPDYVPYQIYDSLQAFSSSIAGLLASRAVLEGLGIGGADNAEGPGNDAESSGPSSATAVVLLSILQESMGRLATILFAWRLGTHLEPEAKSWRLAADIFNDFGMILDCISPIIPSKSYWGWYVKVGMLSGASVLRALCGVAAGSSKATLSQHFAIDEMGGNIGELNAVGRPWLPKWLVHERLNGADGMDMQKDSSQETVISLLGMWAGSLVLSMTKSLTASSITLICLLCVHITMNYLAVRSVCMRSLNRQRANIVFSSLYQSGRVLTPAEAARVERIFEKDGVLRWNADVVLGRCQIGVSMKKLLQLISTHHYPKTGAFEEMEIEMEDLLKLFKEQGYVLWFNQKRRSAVVVLKLGATAGDQLKGWTHALVLAREVYVDMLNDPKKVEAKDYLRRTIERTLRKHDETFETNLDQLQEAGWDLDTTVLETYSGSRITM